MNIKRVLLSVSLCSITSAAFGGICDCPDDYDINGNICGARSAYCRPGGYEPQHCNTTKAQCNVYSSPSNGCYGGISTHNGPTISNHDAQVVAGVAAIAAIGIIAHNIHKKNVKLKEAIMDKVNDTNAKVYKQHADNLHKLVTEPSHTVQWYKGLLNDRIQYEIKMAYSKKYRPFYREQLTLALEETKESLIPIYTKELSEWPDRLAERNLYEQRVSRWKIIRDTTLSDELIYFKEVVENQVDGVNESPLINLFPEAKMDQADEIYTELMKMNIRRLFKVEKISLKKLKTLVARSGISPELIKAELTKPISSFYNLKIIEGVIQ